MQSLNSISYLRRTLTVAGIGMFITFLFLVPLTAFAASSTVTVTSPTAGTFIAPDTPITVTGTVSPAPTTSTTYIVISILEPNGQTATENEVAVTASTGAFSLSFTTGGPNFAANGTYAIDLNYNGATASTSVAYGNITSTTSSSQSGVTTTIYSDVTTTVSAVVTSATTIFSSAVSTVSAATTTTVSAATTTTIVESPTSSGGSGTAEAIAAVAIIIAIIAIIFAVLGMRKK